VGSSHSRYWSVYKFHRDVNRILIQHSTLPTRVRASNTPHILDLVITNDTFIEDIEYHAHLGKSDHCMLFINCRWQLIIKEPKHSRLNYDKGNYEAFKEFLKIDWKCGLDNENNYVEVLWENSKELCYVALSSLYHKLETFLDTFGKDLSQLTSETK